jgi:hypothetical protein
MSTFFTFGTEYRLTSIDQSFRRLSLRSGRSGRKKFVPTPDHRDLVKLLATPGIPQELIRNPQTGKPVSLKTFKRAFATEIKIARVELHFQVGMFIIDTILGRRPVNATPIKDEQARLMLIIFFAKTHGLFR